MTPKVIMMPYKEPTNFCYILTLKFVDFPLCGLGWHCTLYIWPHMFKELLEWHERYLPSDLPLIQRPRSISTNALSKSSSKSTFCTQFPLVDNSRGQHLLTLKFFSSKTLRSGEYFKYPDYMIICCRSTNIQHFLEKSAL